MKLECFDFEFVKFIVLICGNSGIKVSKKQTSNLSPPLNHLKDGITKFDTF